MSAIYNSASVFEPKPDTINARFESRHLQLCNVLEALQGAALTLPDVLSDALVLPSPMCISQAAMIVTITTNT